MAADKANKWEIFAFRIMELGQDYGLWNLLSKLRKDKHPARLEFVSGKKNGLSFFAQSGRQRKCFRGSGPGLFEALEWLEAQLERPCCRRAREARKDGRRFYREGIVTDDNGLLVEFATASELCNVCGKSIGHRGY